MSTAAEQALKLVQWMTSMKEEFAFTKSLLSEIGNSTDTESDLNLLDLLEEIDGISNKCETLEEHFESTKKIIKKEDSDLRDEMEVARKIFNQFKLKFGITSN